MRAFRSRWCRASRRRWASRPTAACRSRIATTPRSSLSSPATRSTGSIGRRWASRRRWSSSWVSPRSTQIAAELIANGRAADTPAMAVRWATRPDQETLVGTLATLPGMIRERGLKPPATIVVGEVVRLREKLNWYEHLPLFGTRIVVTRAEGQAGVLTGEAARPGRGCGRAAHDRDRAGHGLRGARSRHRATSIEYDWLIFTSANGVKYFLERLDAVGGGSAQAAGEDLRHRAGHAPGRREPASQSGPDGQGVRGGEPGGGFRRAPDSTGKRILLPRAAVARDVLPAELRRRGAQVDVVEAYRTVIPPEAAAERAGDLRRRRASRTGSRSPVRRR